MIGFSRFDHCGDNKPKQFDADTLADIIADLEIDADTLPHHIDDYAADKHLKKSLPLFALANFNGTRSAANVTSVNALVLDIDNTTEQALADWLTSPACPIRDTEFYAYSTISHGYAQTPEECSKFRFIVALSRPVTGAEWYRLYALIERDWDLPGLDTSTKDPSRMFIVPIEHESYEYLFYSDLWQGSDAFDVEAALSIAPENAKQRGFHARGAPQTSPVGIDDLRDRLDRPSRGIHNNETRRMVRALLKGTVFTTHRGTSHQSLLEITSWVVPRCGDVDTDSLLNLFAPSCVAQEDEVGSSIDELDLIKLIDGARTRFDRVPTKNVTALKKPKRVSVSPGHADTAEVHPAVDSSTGEPIGFAAREGNYTAAEEADCARYAGVDPETCDVRAWPWILRLESTFYFLTPQGYVFAGGPKSSSMVRARDDIGLGRAPLTLHEEIGPPNDRQRVVRSLEKLAEDYGQRVHHIVGDLSRQTNHWDPVTRTMYEATAIVNDFTPTAHADVMAWLKILFASDLEAGLDWLASVYRLDRQTRVLSIVGKTGAGKTLLSHGIAARYLPRSPTPLSLVIGRFNSMVATQPIIVGDEHTDGLTLAHLRRLSGGELGSFERKGIDAGKLWGFPRLIITTNDMEHFSSRTPLTADAQQATAERFLHMVVSEKAADYLATLTPERRNEFKTHAIAETCLWLQENREIHDSGRYLGRAGGVDVAKEIAIMSDGPSIAAGIIIEWIAKGGMISRGDSPPITVTGKQVSVTRSYIEQHWNTRDNKPPAPRALTGALEALGRQVRGFEVAEGKTRRPRYWKIDTDKLIAYTERTGSIEPSAIYDVLNRGFTPPIGPATVTAIRDRRKLSG